MNDIAENPLDIAPTPKERGSALLHCGVFLGFGLLMDVVLVVMAKKLLGPSGLDQIPGVSVLILVEAIQTLTTVVIPSVIVILLFYASRRSFGLESSGWLPQLGIGVLTGLAAMSILIGLIALLGGVHTWTGPAPQSGALLSGLGYILTFALVAISEEGFLRSYALVQLSRAISFWPAAIVTSVIFLALHLVHQTESVIGLTQVGLIGLILAYSVRRTGAIWFALGCHGAWDFAETYLYGVPDSGVTAPGALSHVMLSGPGWLTGGVTGPEASGMVFPALAVIALAVRFVLPKTGF